MKAKRESPINRERHKLEEVLPLRTPYAMDIDPCNLCNFRCRFCAMQSSEESLNFKKQMMQMPLFKKVIDDITEFPEKLKILHLANYGEPLLHPDFPEMVRYAKKKDVSELVATVTNGSKLNPELNQALIDSGLDRIRISVEAVSEEGYLEIAGAKIDLEQFAANIRDLHGRSLKAGGSCEIYVKTVDVAVETKEKQERFYQLFEEACDRIFIDCVTPIWAGWEEINERFDIKKIGSHKQEWQRVRVCPYPFYNLCVTPDGIVNACCADWKRELALGDLKEQSLVEIWNGENLCRFWMDMLSGHKDQYPICESCQYPMYNCNDNIDSYAEVLLQKFQAKG